MTDVTRWAALIGGFLGEGALLFVSWRTLRLRCARPAAYLALAGIGVGLGIAAVAAWLTRDWAFIAVAIAIALALGFEDGQLVRLTGGAEPALMVQYRLRAILDRLSGTPPASDRVREARERLAGLDALRDARTAGVIEATHELFRVRFDTEPVVETAIKQAYDRLQAEIAELQRVAGRPPDQSPRSRDIR